MLKFPITFVSGREGDGFMFLHDETMQVVKVTDIDGVEIPSDPPYSYYCTGNNVFVEPALVADPPAPPAPIETELTVLEFRNLFTQQEKASIYSLAKLNPMVEAWLGDLAAAKTVVLQHQQTIDSVNSLAALGAITLERAAEVLGA